MASAARKITIIVDGDAGPLDAALEKAAGSLEGFSSQLEGMATAAKAATAEAAAANADLGASFVDITAAARSSIGEQINLFGDMGATWKETTAAIQRDAEAQISMWADIGDEVMSAVDRSGEAMQTYADQVAEVAAKNVAEAQRIDEAWLTVGGTMEDLGIKATETAGVIGDALGEIAAMAEAESAKTITAFTGVEDALSRYAASLDAVAADSGPLIASIRGVDGALADQAATVTSTGVRMRAQTATTAKSFGDSGTSLVKWGKDAALGLAAIAGGSLYLSAKFEQSMMRIHTQAGASVEELHKLEKGLLKFGLEGGAGQTPKALEEGLYHIVSSMGKVLPEGTRVNEMLHIMRIAAEGAAVGGTTMQETAYALASAMNALHRSGKDAYTTMGELNAIVGSGDMTMSDLLASMKSGVVPTAEQFGVSLRSLGAALAVMGDMGMRGAQAGTRLRMSLALLGGPSKQAAQILTTLGMSAREVSTHNALMAQALEKAGLHMTSLAEDMRKPNGLFVALSDLKDHLEKAGLSSEASAGIMVRAFGGGRMAATIDLLTQNLNRLQIKYAQIGEESGKFGSDYKATQETISQQWKETLSALEAVGITIGKDLTPEAKEAFKDLRDLFEWFEKNRVAAAALAGVIGTGLSAALAAFAINRAKAFTGDISEAFAHLGFGGGGASSEANLATAGGGFAGKLTGGQIAGARGLSLPGSLANPIVVAIESGQYAGLGGMGAKSASEPGVVTASDKEIATAENGGVPVGMMPQEAVAAESAGVLSTIKAGLGNVFKGGLVALGGMFVSEMAGSIVGGKAGKTVTGIGNDAALGAAIGTAIEPGIGTAIGGGLGAIAGALKHLSGPGPGAETAKHIFTAAGLPKGLSEREMNEAGLDAEKLRVAESEAPSVSYGRGPKIRVPGGNPRLLQRVTEEEQYYGEQLGQHLGGAISQYDEKEGVRNRTTTGIADEIKAALAAVPAAGKDAVVRMTTEMAATLEKEGRLPKGAVEHLIREMGPLMNSLPLLAGESGKDFSTKFVSEMHAEKMLEALSKVTQNISKEWESGFGILPVTTHMKLAEVETVANTDLGKLSYLMKHGTEQQQKEAAAEYAKLAPSLHGYLIASQATVRQDLATIAGHVKDLSAEAKTNIIEAWAELPAGLKTQLEHAKGAVHKGLEEINAELNADLSNLGAAKVGGVTVKITGKGQLHGGGKGAAGGALIQLGRPGEAGHDSIPMNVGGQGIVAAPGEQIAVLTRHQQAAIASAIPGGLPAVLSNKRPHYMAEGGLIGEPQVSGTGAVSKIAQQTLRLGAEAAQASLEAAGGGGGTGGGSPNIGSGFTGSWVQVMEEIARRKGWSIPDWKGVIAIESGGRPSIPNASGSNAWGLGQLKPENYDRLGGGPGSSPQEQVEAMARYIAERYGNPTAALAHEHSSGWYYEGGLIHADGGLDATAASRYKLPKLSPGPAAKAPPSKKVGGSAKNIKAGHKPSSIASLVARLGKLRGVPNMHGIEGEERQVAALANLQSLLANVEGEPGHTFLTEANIRQMQAAGVSMEGVSLRGGMEISEALRLAGTDNPGLTEWLDYFNELPQNHLLTSADVGTLAAAAGPAGVTLRAEEPVSAAAQNVLYWVQNKDEGLAHTEENLRAVVHEKALIYKQRMSQIHTHAAAEFARYQGIKKTLADLKLGGLSAKLKIAEDKARKAVLIEQAEDSERAISANIAGERALGEDENKDAIAVWETQKLGVEDYVSSLRKATSGVPAARLAIREATLTNALTPIEEQLGALTGNRTQVGKGGYFGEYKTELGTLESIAPTLTSDYLALNQSTIPTVRVEYERTRQENAEAGIKPPPTAGAAAGETAQEQALTDLLKEALTRAVETIAIQGADLAAMSGLTSKLPHYEQGGPVLETGLAVVHKGEHVVPVGGTLVANSSPAPVVNVENHVHGDLGPLISLIDTRVAHPQNVRAISRQMARRSNLLPG